MSYESTISFSPETNEIAFVELGQDGEQNIVIWDVDLPREIYRFNGSEMGIYNFSWGLNGLAIIAFDEVIRIWNPTSATQILFYDRTYIESISWSPDGARLLTNGMERNEFQIIDFQSGEVLSYYEVE